MRRSLSLLDLRAPLTVVGAAALAWVAPTPWFGVPALVTLIWLAGSSIVLLALDDPELDRLVYSVTSGIAGLAVLVATALVMYAVGVRIDATHVPIAVGLAGVVLTGLSSGPRAARHELAHHGDPLDWLHWAVAAALLIGAASFALAVQKPTPDTWALMSLDKAQVVAADPLTASPGAAVTVRWSLQVHGYRPPSTDVAVVVQVGADTVKPTRSSATMTRSSDGADVAGSTTVTAPSDPGLYRVQIQTTTIDAKGRSVVRAVNVHVQVTSP